MTTNTSSYLGRFAPSPTGPLHFGSLLAATGSYLQARHEQGQWQLRVEDIDPPREVDGAIESIITALDNYGFEWDGEIIYQSKRIELYREYLEQLIKNEQAFVCSCSRKDIAQIQKHTELNVYPGTCRKQKRNPHGQYAYRIYAHEGKVEFDDGIQGKQLFDLQTEIGDFVIKRADGFYSYQLAVAVDDAVTGITEVVRGSDLLDSTPRQIYIQQALDLPTPDYFHLPVATNSQGQKLSKQTFARPLDNKNIVKTLYQVLQALGQQPETELKSATLDEFWQWAIEHWNVNNIPNTLSFIYQE